MKNKFKGTPGPWVSVRMSRVCIGVGKKHQAGYSQMIVNMILPETDEDYRRERPEIESNARLIAAAPEMLEALQELVEVWESGLAKSIPAMNQEPAYRKAKEVIKKALGE